MSPGLPCPAVAEQMGGIGAVLEDELELARNLDHRIQAVVLVEGESDRRALETLAADLGRNLLEEGTVIVAIAGATNVDRFLSILGPKGRDLIVVGLCDEDEAAAFHSAFDVVGIASGVYVCSVDLEDELIRALGVDRMLEIISEQDELRAFHSFQNQPDQRHKTLDRQMWRWLGNRKIRYASVLVGALDNRHVPMPLLGVLRAVSGEPAHLR